ncbi:enoyl-CoA delta isomerase 1, mitochondrial isoform X2 [Anabrus simplex]|uniref:enoyl-CoA delta isomerase 1, mitochondrial isoform X2 n=1 Tax=Anabrus simplex TaxID=316456 RepID=UPI0034DD4C99
MMPSVRHCMSLLPRRGLPLLSPSSCPAFFPLQRQFASGEKLVDVAVNDKTGVSTVTMQRLPVNSLNLELLEQLHGAFTTLENNNCRGMILTSASPTVFSAGLDIMEMYKPNPDRVKKFWTTLQDTWLKLYSTPYATVAAINGHSPAGGCLLALSCEYRIMVGPKFTIGLNETQLGIIAPKWFQISMTNVIPPRQAELALSTGKMFTTEEALKVGLIDEIANDKQDAIAKAEKFLAMMAKIPESSSEYIAASRGSGYMPLTSMSSSSTVCNTSFKMWSLERETKLSGCYA